ncbi:MAG: aspartate aminotransferase family protein [Firmicutes bacterium]|nr:aspartate aminotransferase family protein [Bacillota bacterium]
MSALLTLDQALELSRSQIRELYRAYINPGLVTMLELLDFDRRFVAARGAEVRDAAGNTYLDFLGAYGALNLGHNHPAVLEAVRRVEERPNLLQASLNPVAAALAHNLAQLAPGDLRRSFFCNSGAEAVEGALKLARAATGRSQIVYCGNSFHGKTFGALSVTGREKYRRPFEPLLPDCVEIPFGDDGALENVLKQGRAAAFIVEPIQGEGGVIVPPDGYLSRARELCTRYGALLIADEIQTGLGRTGYLWACDHEGVVPDVLCVAKSLGGGAAAIGAYVTTEAIWKRAYGGLERALLHTSTFGGNTRAAAAALAALEVTVKEDLAGRARELGGYLLGKLRELQEKAPLLAHVRGRGLLVGLEFAQSPGGFVGRLSGGILEKVAGDYLGSLVAGELLNRHRIITAYTLNNPNVIRLEPPLTVTREQIDACVDGLAEVLGRHRSFLSVAASGARTVLQSVLTKGERT